jgi:hypothetical protein
MNDELLHTIGFYILGVMGVSLVLALLLLLIVWRQVKRIKVPPNAGFAETLHYTPFLVVLLVDLLDLALDFLAAPVAWVLLGRLGLQGLRGVSVVEALIPFTQPIPTMTLSWIGVRLLGRGQLDPRDVDDAISRTISSTGKKKTPG